MLTVLALAAYRTGHGACLALAQLAASFIHDAINPVHLDEVVTT